MATQDVVVIEETVSLNFDGKNLDEIEARLARAADQIIERLKAGAAGVTVGGAASPGASPPAGASGGTGRGGSGGDAGPFGTGFGAGGAAAAGVSAAINGVAQSMGNLTPATVNSPAVVAREAELGAAKGIVGLGTTAIGAAIGMAIGGPVGTAVGAAAGNVLGTYAAKQFEQLDESIHAPEDRVAARLKSYVGTMEAHGIHLSNRFIEQQARFGIALERRRLQGERRAERLTHETGIHMGSVSWGISQLGR